MSIGTSGRQGGNLESQISIKLLYFLISCDFRPLINFSFLSVPVAQILYLSINPLYLTYAQITLSSCTYNIYPLYNFYTPCSGVSRSSLEGCQSGSTVLPNVSLSLNNLLSLFQIDSTVQWITSVLSITLQQNLLL